MDFPYSNKLNVAEVSSGEKPVRLCLLSESSLDLTKLCCIRNMQINFGRQNQTAAQDRRKRTRIAAASSLSSRFQFYFSHLNGKRCFTQKPSTECSKRPKGFGIPLKHCSDPAWVSFSLYMSHWLWKEICQTFFLLDMSQKMVILRTSWYQEVHFPL